MSCGPLSGEASTPLPARRGNRAVIEGVVVRDGELLPGAYVRLLDAGGEFVAEVQTDWAGRLPFFAAFGDWTLRTLSAGADVTDERVAVGPGAVVPVEVLLD